MTQLHRRMLEELQRRNYSDNTARQYRLAVRQFAEHFGKLADMDVRQWVDYAGVDPRQHRSRSSVEKKPRTSKTGNKHLRRALYMPALVAIVHESHLRAFYQHLLARGKAKLQALVGVMRKLLHAIFCMFKHDQAFEGSKVYSPLPAADPNPPAQEAA